MTKKTKYEAASVIREVLKIRAIVLQIASSLHNKSLKPHPEALSGPKRVSQDYFSTSLLLYEHQEFFMVISS